VERDKIDKCIVDVDDLPIINPSDIAISAGVDPAYSSDGSKFAIAVISFIDGKYQVLDALQYSGLTPNDSINYLFNLLGSKYNWNVGDKRVKVFIDSTNPGYIRECKRYIGENEEYEYLIKDTEAKKNRIRLDALMDIVPVGFAEHGLPMLQALQTYVSNSWLVIPTDMEDLIMQL